MRSKQNNRLELRHREIIKEFRLLRKELHDLHTYMIELKAAPYLKPQSFKSIPYNDLPLKPTSLDPSSTCNEGEKE